MRRKNKAERDMFDEFTGEHPFCWGCGIPDHPQYPILADGVEYLRCLDVHHLGRGYARADDRRNLARLCRMCHELSSGATIKLQAGRKIAPLTLAHVLWLKYHHDRPHYDRSYLRHIRGRAVPPIKCPPRWFVDVYLARRNYPATVKMRMRL